MPLTISSTLCDAYIYTCLPANIRICINTHSCKHAYTYRPIYIPIYIPKCMHLYIIHAYTYNHTYTFMHVFLYAVVSICIQHMCMLSLIHTDLCMSVYISQVLKLGYERYIMVPAWRGKGNRLGMLADAQVSWYDSTVHVQRFFPPKVQNQMTVTWFNDVTDVLLMYIRDRYKKKHTWDPGEFGSVILPCSPVRLSKKPQTL